MKYQKGRYPARNIILVVFIFGSLQCQDDVKEWEPDSSDMVITEYVYSQPEQLSEFGAVLEYTGIENFLRVRGPFTLFVPTDDAMREYYTRHGVSSFEEIEVEELHNMVYTHILGGAILAGSIPLGALIYENGLADRVASDFLGIDILLNKVALISKRDIQTSNGVVHHIDYVLEPIYKTVVEILEDIGGYSIFLEGLERSGLTDTLMVIEFDYGKTTARSKYTIMAVPDTLYQRDGINSVEDLIELYADDDNLTDSENGFRQYMEYHCLTGTNYFSDFLPNAVYYTLSGDNYLSIVVEEDYKINKTDTGYVGFYSDLSNYPAKNGVIHTVNSTFANTETTLREITHQITDYFDLKQGSYYLNHYARFFDGENSFSNIKFGGSTLLYYLKPGHHLMDDDCIKMEGHHYWIEITTPKIRKGKYNVSGFFFQGGDRGVLACSIDGEYMGVVNPNEGAWGGDPMPFGEVNFEETETHKIRLKTIQPGRMFWDYVRFTPVR